MTAYAGELAQIDALLRAGGAGQEFWSADLAAKREEGIDSYRTFLSKRVRTDFGKTWTSFSKLMLRVADSYLSAGSTERAVLRKEVQGAENVAIHVAGLFEEWTHLVTAGEAALLRRALALVSLLESAGDDQLLGPGLDWLLQRGKDAAIDVTREMRGVAKISTEPTKSLFQNFEPADTSDWPEPPVASRTRRTRQGKPKSASLSKAHRGTRSRSRV